MINKTIHLKKVRMFPVLIEFGSIQIHTYGLLIATGFLVCLYFVKREALRTGVNPEHMIDLGFFGLLVGMIGARILYVLTRWDYFSQDWPAAFRIWEGGLVFWAGPLLNIPFFVWYAKRHAMPKWKALDIGAYGIPIAHAFGRVGCFAAGCCYGKPTTLPIGVSFGEGLVDVSLRYVPLHPVQLYESVLLLALWGVLHWRRTSKKFDGELALIYLILYSLLRAVTEVFRGDLIRGFVVDGWLSTSQFISLIVIVLASGLYGYLWTKGPSKTAEQSRHARS